MALFYFPVRSTRKKIQRVKGESHCLHRMHTYTCELHNTTIMDSPNNRKRLYQQMTDKSHDFNDESDSDGSERSQDEF